MGKLIKGISKNARFFICDTKDLVQEAMDIHSCSPTGIAALGKVLTAAGMMGKDLKSDSDLLTIRVNGDGPAGVIIATANKHGEVKGYMGNPQVDRGCNRKRDFICNKRYGAKRSFFWVGAAANRRNS